MYDANHRHHFHAFDDAANTERSLSSYYAAVAQEYGSEQAAKAARDWIEVLQKSCLERHVDWRSVTIAAALRLAHRVVPLHKIEGMRSCAEPFTSERRKNAKAQTW
jgi:hypothetical protein